MTMVEVRGYKFRWEPSSRSWAGPGAPTGLETFVNLVQPDPATASYDPNPAATRASYLQKTIGAKILSVDATEPIQEGVCY